MRYRSDPRGTGGFPASDALFSMKQDVDRWSEHEALAIDSICVTHRTSRDCIHHGSDDEKG
jgi:hypothetical protein